MSRLRMVSSKRFDDLLRTAPGALEADTAMRRSLALEEPQNGSGRGVAE